MTALIITLFLPLIGSLALLFFRKTNVKLIKWFAFLLSTLTFVISLVLFFSFDKANAGFQFTYSTIWITSLDAGFRIGLDGMSLLLVLLTSFISPIAILSSFDAIKKREKEYYIMLLLLEFAMLGVFAALDTFLFYVFWELILIPMYFIIGIWGGKDRIYAAVKFFLFTVVGSLFMLVAIVWLGWHTAENIILQNPETSSPILTILFSPNEAASVFQAIKNSHFTTNFIVLREFAPLIQLDYQIWLFLAFALSFCIKVPLFPLHTWLPDAHTEAPTAGSVILAGVLLKMGTYGLMRFNIDLFPQASVYFAPWIGWLAVAGIVYGALVSLVQTDVKRLVAYSSVSHLGFVVLGIFSMTAEGMQGAVIQMVNHGLSTGMLFLCVGVIYERRHTRMISEFGGIARVMPAYSVMFGIAMLASVGLPGLNGFIGEYLTLLGAFSSPYLGSNIYTIISATGVIFAACYLLWMFRRVMFGTIDNEQNKSLVDLNKIEWATLAPIVVFIVWIGIYPNTFLSISEKSVRSLSNKVEKIQYGKTTYKLTETLKERGNREIKK
ncbi:MAG: nuoM [Ignavibacteria bacterium]|nr:nuoM [Ignavibacteria bacterium]